MKRFGRVRLVAALFLMLIMMLSSLMAAACALRFEVRTEKAKPVMQAAEDPCRHAGPAGQPAPHSCYTKYVPLTFGPGMGGALQAPAFVAVRVTAIFPDDVPLPVSAPMQTCASLLARATAPPVCIRICSFQI